MIKKSINPKTKSRDEDYYVGQRVPYIDPINYIFVVITPANRSQDLQFNQ